MQTAASGPAPPARPPASPSVITPSENPYKDCRALVIGGFPRDIPKAALKAHFTAVMQNLDDKFIDVLVFGSRARGQAYIIYVKRPELYGSAFAAVQELLTRDEDPLS